MTKLVNWWPNHILEMWKNISISVARLHITLNRRWPFPIRLILSTPWSHITQSIVKIYCKFYLCPHVPHLATYKDPLWEIIWNWYSMSILFRIWPLFPFLNYTHVFLSWRWQHSCPLYTYYHLYSIEHFST